MNATILTLLLLSAAPRGPVPSPKPVEYATLIDTDEDDSPKFELKVRDSDLSTLPDDTASLSVAWMQAVSAMGQGSTTNIEATYGLTDRLEIGLSTLALAYRYGEPGEGKVEWTPWVGLIEWNFMSAYSRLFFVGNLGAGLGARVWIDGRSSLVAQAAVYTPMASQVGSHWIIEPFELWSGYMTLGYQRLIGEKVMVNVGAAFMPEVRGEGTILALGGVLQHGLRHPPLIRVNFGGSFSLDLYGGAVYGVDGQGVTMSGGLGGSWVF